MPLDSRSFGRPCPRRLLVSFAALAPGPPLSLLLLFISTSTLSDSPSLLTLLPLSLGADSPLSLLLFISTAGLSASPASLTLVLRLSLAGDTPLALLFNSAILSDSPLLSTSLFRLPTAGDLPSILFVSTPLRWSSSPLPIPFSGPALGLPSRSSSLPCPASPRSTRSRTFLQCLLAPPCAACFFSMRSFHRLITSSNTCLVFSS
mmetsp:Transcript_59075/g.149912  ORF Transcript_59075/g.149912 Transcript_59075/m.149912 type:complete len:205 (+) Transcript_59075:139-753(+)